MNENKSLIIVKESFFKKFINKIRNFFKGNTKEEIYEESIIENKKITPIQGRDNRKSEFLDKIKVQEVNSGIIALKIQLENGEVKAVDLTDEQIDELQEIYDKEIEEKEAKLKRLKGIA